MGRKIPFVSSLCGALWRRRKSSPPPSPPPPISEDNAKEDLNVPKNETGDDGSAKQSSEPLPPPPKMRHFRTASFNPRPKTSAPQPQRKLSSSRSMRVLGRGLSFRQSSRMADNDRKPDKNLNQEDSIWKKTIILGEKCRVPDDDDVFVYDEDGKKISTYHPKAPTSLPVSRQASFTDPEALARVEKR